jgi:hypothetical protein
MFCLSIITNAFDIENHQDSIEELIVASKQISKRQHNNNSYYYFQKKNNTQTQSYLNYDIEQMKEEGGKMVNSFL